MPTCLGLPLFLPFFNSNLFLIFCHVHSILMYSKRKILNPHAIFHLDNICYFDFFYLAQFLCFKKYSYTSLSVQCKLHGNENPIYVFIFWELYGLIFMCQWAINLFPGSVHYSRIDQSWKYINRSQTYECENWDCGRAIPFLNICIYFEFSVLVVCSVGEKLVGSLRICHGADLSMTTFGLHYGVSENCGLVGVIEEDAEASHEHDVAREGRSVHGFLLWLGLCRG
jgi:hypothetical protein